MQLLSIEAFHLVYGLTYFILGLAVGARVLGYQPSAFRNRLLALASFGLLHACAIWFLLINPTATGISFHLQAAFYAGSFLSLYYFALGWNERWPMVAHIIVVGTVCSLIIASLLITNQAPMQFFSRLNLGLPATICAALAFIYDSAFRFGSRSSDLARWLVATMFFVYAALFLFFHTATFLPPPRVQHFRFRGGERLDARSYPRHRDCAHHHGSARTPQAF